MTEKMLEGVTVEPFPLPNGDEIRIQPSTWKGKTRIDVRVWYKDETTGKMAPTKKGLSLDDEPFEWLITNLVKIARSLGVEV